MPADNANVRFLSPEPSDDNDDESQTTLLFYSHRSNMGAAYLTPPAQGAVLHVMHDTPDSASFDTARLVLDQVEPDLLLVNSNAQEELIELSQTYCNSNDCSFEIRPEIEFKYPKSKSHILSLHLPAIHPSQSVDRAPPFAAEKDAYGRLGMDVDGPDEDDEDDQDGGVRKEMMLSGLIDFSQLCAVCAEGGLVGYLTKVESRRELRGIGEASGLRVGGIESFTPAEYMHISAETLSLGVFTFESHSYTFSTPPTKSSLSLFSLLSTTLTPSGGQLLQAWLLRPLLSLKLINLRHEAVQTLAKPGNASVVGGLKNTLKGVKNVRRVLEGKMRRGVAASRDWRCLLEFCFKMVQLKDGMEELIGVQKNGSLHLISNKINSDLLVQLGQTFNETIDWDESTLQNRVCCKAGIDPLLDEWKFTYASLDSFLMTVADSIAQTLSADVFKSLNVTYFPQLGFLMAVQLRRSWEEMAEDEELGDLEFQFYTDEITYFKSSKMRDLDAHFGDVHSAIVDREIEIVQGLLEQTLAHEGELLIAVEASAELDCLIAFAGAALDWNWRRPEMTEENVLVIKKGRHPLLEVVLDHFVPNSTLLHGGHGLIDEQDDDQAMLRDGEGDKERGRKKSVMVLTGSNASGKSVHGKTLALITYMAHVGCFVPAESASIGLTDKIFTRLSTKESVSKLQSSFAIDLNQISFALRNCTSRSLLIIDEFGKGTITTDGAGLLAATIMHLLKRGKECPKTLVMTHFHELFMNDILPSNLPIHFASMEVIISPDTTRTNPITYLHRLAPSLKLESHAVACAQSQGLSSEIIARSVEVQGHLSKFEYLPLQQQTLTEDDIQDLYRAEKAVRSFLAADYSRSGLSRNGKDLKEELRKMLGLEEEA